MAMTVSVTNHIFLQMLRKRMQEVLNPVFKDLGEVTKGIDSEAEADDAKLDLLGKLLTVTIQIIKEQEMRASLKCKLMHSHPE